MNLLGSQSLTIVIDESQIILKNPKGGEDRLGVREGSIRRTVRSIAKSKKKRNIKLSHGSPGHPPEKASGGCFLLFGNIFGRTKRRK